MLLFLHNYTQRSCVNNCAGFRPVSLSPAKQLNEDNILSANHQNPALLLNTCYKLGVRDKHCQVSNEITMKN